MNHIRKEFKVQKRKIPRWTDFLPPYGRFTYSEKDYNLWEYETSNYK